MDPPRGEGFSNGDRELLIRIHEQQKSDHRRLCNIEKQIGGESGLIARLAKVETRTIILWGVVLGLMGLSGSSFVL